MDERRGAAYSTMSTQGGGELVLTTRRAVRKGMKRMPLKNVEEKRTAKMRRRQVRRGLKVVSDSLTKGPDLTVWEIMKHEISLMESGVVDEFAGIGVASSTKVAPNTQFPVGSVLRALQDMSTGCEAEHWLEVGCISTQVCPVLAKAAELFAMDVSAR
ncbi:hypothetical protein FOZ62_016180, partial [Perkinsus olseni]